MALAANSQALCCLFVESEELLLLFHPSCHLCQWPGDTRGSDHSSWDLPRLKQSVKDAVIIMQT